LQVHNRKENLSQGSAQQTVLFWGQTSIAISARNVKHIIFLMNARNKHIKLGAKETSKFLRKDA
jgi:hypothetical protein